MIAFMRTLYFFAVLSGLILLTACQSEQQKLQDEISAVEKTIDEDPTTENAQALIKRYDAYIDMFPEDHETNARYLYRSAALLYRMNRFSGAINRLNSSLKNHYEASTSPKAVAFLGDIYLEELNNPDNAYSLYQSLIKAFPDSEEAKSVLAKMPGGLPDMESRLKSLGAQIYNDSLNRIEYRIANNFIISSESYSLVLPNAEDTPEVLYKAAEVARSIRSFNKALELYETINSQYPEHEKSSQSLFMRAFTLDSDLRQIDEARKLYESFISQYPDDDFVDDAQVLLDNLGKDDEAIIEAITKGQQNFEQQKKKDKSTPVLKDTE
jgi:TolA-binding protein